MGLDPASIAIISSMVASAGSNIFGASSANNTNNNNLQAQLAHASMMQNYANRMFQPGMNPFAQQMLNFTGQGLPSAVSSFNPYGAPAAPTPGPSGGSGPNPGTPSGGGDGNNGNGGGPITDANVLQAQAALSSYFSSNPGASYRDFNDSPEGQRYDDLARTANLPSSYTLVQNPNALNTAISSMSAANATGFATPSGTTYNSDKTNYSTWVTKYGRMWSPDTAPPDGLTNEQLQTWQHNNPNVAGYAPSVVQALTQSQGIDQSTDAGQQQMQQIWAPFYNGTAQTTNPIVAPNQTSADRYLQNGVYTDGSGQVIGYQGPNGMQATPYDPTGGAGTGGGGSGTYGSSGMYTYTPQQGNTYAPSLLTNAPLIGSSQGQNAGQDSLMQMMRNPLQSATDSSIAPNLAQINSGDTQFNNSDLFKALQPIAQQGLDTQVGQLRGGAGSLGERFGTALNQNEAMLRANVQNTLNLQNAQFAQSSFENAQNRRLQGLGLSSQNLQAQNQFNLGAQGQAQQAATAYGSNQLQTSLANQNLLAQYGINNANISNQANQFNASARTGANQFNAQQGNIYNSTVLSALQAAANTQQAQSGYNAGILGILGGVGVPQQQPNPLFGAIGDSASSMAMLPLLLQMMGQGGGGGSNGWQPYQYGTYNNPPS